MPTKFDEVLITDEDDIERNRMTIGEALSKGTCTALNILMVTLMLIKKYCILRPLIKID